MRPPCRPISDGLSFLSELLALQTGLAAFIRCGFALRCGHSTVDRFRSFGPSQRVIVRKSCEAGTTGLDLAISLFPYPKQGLTMARRQTSGSARLLGSDRFLYRSVSRNLRNLIDAGIYGPGAQLPSAGELAKEFGVSTITIRRAIRDLSLEGHLIGRQGLGVFVANKRKITRRLLRADSIAPLEDDMRKAGLRPSIEELDLMLAHSGDAGAFELGELGIGYRLERIILADDEPVALDTIWFPQNLGDVSKIRGHFVMSLIQAQKIKFEHIDYQFEGSTATDEQAALLKVMTGFPVLAIRYAGMGKGGVPLIVGRTISRADRFVYEFCARPNEHRAKSSRRNKRER